MYMAKMLVKLTENTCKHANEFTREQDQMILDLTKAGLIRNDSTQSLPGSVLLDNFPVHKSTEPNKWQLNISDVLNFDKND